MASSRRREKRGTYRAWLLVGYAREFPALRARDARCTTIRTPRRIPTAFKNARAFARESRGRVLLL